MRALTALRGVVALPLAAALLAQEPTLPTASAFGTAFDSIGYQPMAGARVSVDSTGLSSITDAGGRFQIAGIPPGTHYLRLEHPLLDSMGVTIRTADMVFTAGHGTVHALATPTAATLIRRFCSPAWLSRGPAVLMGRVREADTRAPAVGAKVSLVWYETVETNAQRPVPRVREVQVGEDGTYRICGLPAKLEGKVQVIRGTLTSGDVAVSFGQNLLALRSMTIAAPGAVVAVAEQASNDTSVTAAPTADVTLIGTAVLRGRVVNRAGQPLPRARVMLAGGGQATTTGADGRFVLDSLPPGTQSVAVRLLGYTPTESAVELSSGTGSNVTVTLDDFVPTLETVRVTAQRDRALMDVGFARRKQIGAGYYLEGSQINTEAQYFSDVLRNVPGIRIQWVGGHQMIFSNRGPSACVAIWIDGTVWQQLEPGDIDDFLKANEVSAVEVYSPSSTPMEFQGRSGGCTAIVVWTARRLQKSK